MATWFVDMAEAADANDGKDRFGFTLTAATFTTTTWTLNQSTLFASYTWTAGDTIYITGGTAVTAGLYEIMSRTSDDEIVLSGDITTDASSPTDVTSSDGPVKTIDNALGKNAAGDTIYVKGGISYTETATPEVTATALARTILEGYTDYPGDGGTAVIDAESTRGTCLSTGVGNWSYSEIRNFEMKNATNNGFNNSGGDYITFVNCSFHDCTNSGAETDNNNTFIDCDFYDNGGYGAENDSNCAYINCKFHGNGASLGYYQVENTGGAFTNCVFYDVGSAGGVKNNGNTLYGLSFTHCTFDGVGTGAIAVAMAGTDVNVPVSLINCIIYDWATGVSAFSSDQILYVCNCIFNSNTNDFANTPVVPEYAGAGWTGLTGRIDLAPLFTDETTFDYTLATGSPALHAGCDAGGINQTFGPDIGALRADNRTIAIQKSMSR